MKIALGPAVLSLLGPQLISGRRQIHFFARFVSICFYISWEQNEPYAQNTTFWVALTTSLCCLRSAGGFASVSISSVWSVYQSSSHLNLIRRRPALIPAFINLCHGEGVQPGTDLHVMLEFTAISLSTQINPFNLSGSLSVTLLDSGCPNPVIQLHKLGSVGGA